LLPLGSAWWTATASIAMVAAATTMLVAVTVMRTGARVEV
jgi:hypothetical protein